MKFIEDKLEELDHYFAPKKESEKWVVILMVAGIIGYLAYSFLLPYSRDLYNKSDSQRKRLEKSIVDKTTYLQSITINNDRDYYVKKYNNDIATKNKHITKIHNNIRFIDSNLEKLSDMLFNKKSWSRFLNSITGKAENNDVNLQYIDSKYADNNGSFGHVLEVGLGCIGTYKNIIRFMNELEQNVLVTDIYDTNLSLDKNSSDISAKIKISVWGINH